MKLFGLLLCALSAALVCSVAIMPIEAWPEVVPLSAYMHTVGAWLPAMVLAFAAVIVLAQPRALIGPGGRALGVIALAVAMLWPAIVLAQEVADAAPNAGTVVNLGELFGDVKGTIVTVAGVMVAALVGWVTALVKKSTGITIDAKLRESLQSAVMNGVTFGLDRVQDLADARSIDVRSQILADGIGYVRRYAPKAVQHFKLTDADLETMLRAKLPAALPAEAKTTGA